MIDKLSGAKLKLKEGYELPKEGELKADILEIDLDYYQLYKDIERK